MADGERFTPSLFDKLTSDVDPARRVSESARTGETPAVGGAFRFYTVPRLDRYTSRAVRAVLLRDLGWLFNTAHLAASVDLSDTPEVATSVLNFGVADLAGKSNTRRVQEQRARDLRAAIRAFEPRLATDRLDVEVASAAERENAVTFVVRTEVVSTLQSLPVEFKTDVELETGAALVRE
jgi:type VI secretion system protein ImpF